MFIQVGILNILEDLNLCEHFWLLNDKKEYLFERWTECTLVETDVWILWNRQREQHEQMGTTFWLKTCCFFIFFFCLILHHLPLPKPIAMYIPFFQAIHAFFCSYLFGLLYEKSLSQLQTKIGLPFWLNNHTSPTKKKISFLFIESSYIQIYTCSLFGFLA